LKLGENTYRMRTTFIYLRLKSLVRHLIVLGAAGSGKSVFIQNMMNDIFQLKQAGYNGIGGFLIDPHGELSKDIISLVPDKLKNEINYIAPASSEEYFPFNVFDADFDATPDSLSKNIADVLKRIWPDGWGVRPDRNLLHVGMALQYIGEASIININRLLGDYTYCAYVTDQLEGVEGYEEIYKMLVEYRDMMDPGGKSSAQFKRQHRELTDSTRNKLEQFSLSSLLKHATGAHTCGFRWREWMDEGKITILDLSHIKNESEKKMYGSMALTMNYQAALTRADDVADKDELSIYPIIVDELPSFIDNNEKVIVDMADRTRYVKVPLIGAAQGLVSQMDHGAANAILRNFANVISYQVNNSEDAQALASHFNHEDLDYTHIQRTPENFAYMSLNIGRTKSRAFSAKMDPPVSEKINVDKVEEIKQRTLREALEREENVKLSKDSEQTPDPHIVRFTEETENSDSLKDTTVKEEEDQTEDRKNEDTNEIGEGLIEAESESEVKSNEDIEENHVVDEEEKAEVHEASDEIAVTEENVNDSSVIPENIKEDIEDQESSADTEDPQDLLHSADELSDDVEVALNIPVDKEGSENSNDSVQDILFGGKRED